MSRSIATRTGDDGMTDLLYGRRVPKEHPQIEAVGAIDELNVALGAAAAAVGPATRDLLQKAQRTLVALMGELACAESDADRYAQSDFAKVTAQDVQQLDQALAEEEARKGKADGWAVPGANPTALVFDQARVVARRAERRLCVLPACGRSVRPELRQWINRLSDLLWILARAAEGKSKIEASSD